MAASSTHLLLQKKEAGSSGASSTRVKKEPGVTPASFARHLEEDAARQLEYQAPNDPEEFPGQRAAERTSLNEVQPGTLEFALAWSRKNAKRTEAKHARPLGLCVNLEEEDAGPSQWRGGD
jgi:hypothetical protein